MRKGVQVSSRLVDYTECELCWALVAWNRYSHHLRWHEKQNTQIKRLANCAKELSDGLGFAGDIIAQLVAKEEDNDESA